MRTTVRAGMALAAALVALAACAGVASASAEDCVSRGCVLLIEVDGLEPGDVSAEKTPFLWALAHPEDAGPLLSGRNGFIWQAGRAPMTAGTAPAAASLLTAANPDQHGVVADEFVDPEIVPISDEDRRVRRLRAQNDQAGGAARPITKVGRPGLLDAASGEHEVAAFLGNPALKVMLQDELANVEVWAPSSADGADPSLCPAPRTAPVNGGSDTDAEAQGALQRDCPARDATTLARAFNELSGTTRTPLVTYVHLAELGRTKQLHGEAEAAGTLAELDAELGAFIQGLSRHVNTQGGFGNTVVAVTGNHGYEPTPLDQRVPHPTDGDKDFADFVAAQSTDGKAASFVGQGTIGTVYWPQATAEQLADMKAAIEGACDCIDEVVPVASLAELHHTWHVNPLTLDGVPSGVGGRLLVTTEAGWAFGRVTPTETEEATNPYLASAGGPRNRGIAVIMNGPQRSEIPHTIRQVEDDYMAVKAGSETPPQCGRGDGVGAALANHPESMADDAAAPGHECQPETVDIAFSLAAMLDLKLDAAPQARFLNEAFMPALGADEVVVQEDEDVQEVVPPPDPPPVVIRTGSLQVVPPPPFVDPFPYRGLVRRIRVRVTDAQGRGYREASRGAPLSTIEVRADFGKPESIVTLTFYKRSASGGRRARLKSVARFKPFVVKRGPVRLRLKIPPQFRPTHLGVLAQEVRSEGPGVKRPVGRPGGGIAAIADARHLHRRKAAGRARG